MDVPKISKQKLLQKFKNYSCFYDFEKRLQHLNLDFKYNLSPLESNQHYKLPFELIVEIFRYLPISLHLNMRLLSSQFNYFDNQYWINHLNILKDKSIDLITYNLDNLHSFEYYIKYYLPLAKEMIILEDKIIPTFDLRFIDKKIKGRSRVGGLPDLPPNYEFPSGYKFILQINFANLDFKHKTHSFNDITRKGILYFFFKIDGSDECMIDFYDGDEELVEKEEKEPCVMYEFKFYEKIKKKEFENLIFYDNRKLDQHITILSMTNIILESNTTFSLKIHEDDYKESKFQNYINTLLHLFDMNYQ